MYITWNKIFEDDLSVKKEEKPTAESLRAAAKVLAEKAKELDKPNLSGSQEAALTKAEAQALCVIKFEHRLGAESTYSFVSKSDCAWNHRKRGDVSSTKYEHKQVMNSFNRIDGKTGYLITYVTILDEDDEVHTYIEYPSS